MLYAPKLSTCSKAQEIKETGNAEGWHRSSEGDQELFPAEAHHRLDLGDRSSWYCVLDEWGELQLEWKLSITAKAMREVFGTILPSRMVLETGVHSPWVSRLLNELGHEVIVAHARNVRLIGESRRKDDRLDARTLARLAGIDPQLLCPVKHRSRKAQADLTLIRHGRDWCEGGRRR